MWKYDSQTCMCILTKWLSYINPLYVRYVRSHITARVLVAFFTYLPMNNIVGGRKLRRSFILDSYTLMSIKGRCFLYSYISVQVAVVSSSAISTACWMLQVGSLSIAVLIIRTKLYYTEWAYQRSRLCHNWDVTTGGICKLGYKCDMNLHLNPYTYMGGSGPVVGFLIRDCYMRCLQYFLCYTCLIWMQTCCNTHVGIWCTWFVLTMSPLPWLIQIKYMCTSLLQVLQLHV